MAQSPSLQEWRGQISADVRHIKDEIGKLPRDMEKLIERIEDALTNHADEDNDRFKDHHSRLVKVENAVIKYGVVIAIGGIVFGWVGAAMAKVYFGG